MLATQSVIGRNRFVVFAKTVFTLCYFIVLFYLVFFVKRRRHQHARYLHIVPIKNTVIELTKVNYALPRDIYMFYSNLIGNIVLFVPFSIITISVFGIYKIRHVLLLSFALSFAIEALQYIFRVGVADIDDILLNTLGAATGILLYNYFKKIRARYRLSHQ